MYLPILIVNEPIYPTPATDPPTSNFFYPNTISVQDANKTPLFGYDKHMACVRVQQ